jgi:hypothetical protein
MLATTAKHQLQLIACSFNANSANPRSARASNSPWKPDERAYNNMVAPLSRGVGTDNTTPSDAREELSINPTAWLLVLRLLLILG